MIRFTLLLCSTLCSVGRGSEPPPSPGASTAPPPIDRVVAVINGRMLTLSELKLDSRIAYLQRGAKDAAFAPLDDPSLRSALKWVIAERLASEEAERLRTFVPTEADLEQALASFKEKFLVAGAFSLFLKSNDADEQELLAILFRSLRAQKYLDSKVHSRGPLTTRRVSDLVKAEIANLENSADIRLIAPFAR